MTNLYCCDCIVAFLLCLQLQEALASDTLAQGHYRKVPVAAERKFANNQVLLCGFTVCQSLSRNAGAAKLSFSQVEENNKRFQAII